MPKITITEKEDLSLGQLSAIENVVLAPLFVNEITDEMKLPKKYTLYKDFEADFKDAVISEGEDGEILDKSYYYIKELLGMGLHVVVKPVECEVSSEGTSEGLDLCKLINEAVNKEDGLFDEFKDRNLYNIKFITTGAYANWNVESGCYKKLAEIANARGDAIALIELDSETDLVKSNFMKSLVDKSSSNYIDIEEVVDPDSSLKLGMCFENAACFYPWGTYVMNFSNSKILEMPASFGYLVAFAYSIQVNEDWLSASGVSRGYIPNLKSLNFMIGDSFMHILQGDEYAWQEEGIISRFYPIRINPIMFKGTYGNRIWGDRVFSWYNSAEANAITESNISYKEYLNVRVLLCDIKKQIYASAVRMTFEPNDDITWINFKGLINNLLDRMQNSRGINWYAWQREYTEKKATIKATLLIRPIEPVEDFEINVQLTDQDATVIEPEI